MTSATTIFGLVPMAVGNTNALGIPYNTLGIAMIGGLLLSTTLTLFVVPLVYALLDDLSIVARRMVSLVRLAPSRTYA
jgi:HAE1 family hydrophobic/amphiphilic exporter-1